MAESQVIPFGKYKGQPLEVLAQDRQYCEWLLAQGWFRDKYQPIYTVVINNFGEPAETPEHNQLQALFTDGAFRERFMLQVYGDVITRRFVQARNSELSFQERRVQEISAELEGVRRRAGWRIGITAEQIEQDAEVEQCKARLERQQAVLEKLEQIATPELHITASFEVKGVDVVLAYDVFPGTSEREVYVECKPSLGDDYPAVLRQITNTGADQYTSLAVLVGRGGYTGTGATLEQVQAIFQSRKVRIAFLADLD